MNPCRTQGTVRNIECRIASAVRGLADASTTPGGDLRECACCGAPTPTQSMCACWPHWMVLPEDLRSELLKSYGRDEFANYHRNILEAIETWRQLGVWRVPSLDG